MINVDENLIYRLEHSGQILADLAWWIDGYVSANKDRYGLLSTVHVSSLENLRITIKELIKLREDSISSKNKKEGTS